jgi:hypothetical protein
MLASLLQDVQTVPDRLRDESQRLFHRIQATPARVAARRDAARQWVTRRALGLRFAGEDRVWSLQLSAIEQANALLARSGALPAVGGLARRAGELLKSVEASALAPPIEGYDEASVRDVMKVLHTLDRLGLMRVQRYEASAKNRKTILDAVRKELERRERVAA